MLLSPAPASPWGQGCGQQVGTLLAGEYFGMGLGAAELMQA